jgi:hypothetical protein
MSTIGNNLVFSSDFITKEILMKKEFDKDSSIFGFGLGDGAYEVEIANFLIQQGLTGSTLIYGYDPYGIPNQSISMLDEAALLRGSLNFDLIIARWVLHHVPTLQRWDIFASALGQLKKGGIAVVVEHGFVDESNPVQNRKLYRLLNAIADLIANVGIRPEWFSLTAPIFGKNYFLNFLTTKDLTSIARATKKKLKISISNTGPIFPWQSIIVMEAMD